MALQLQIRVDLRPNLFHFPCKPVHGLRTRTGTTQLRFEADGGWCASRERPVATADIRVSFTERGRRMSRSPVAAPGYSSLLRRDRVQEMNIHAGDRFMQIAEWVYRKVKDPMVEIDPVTVGKKIKAEEQFAREATGKQGIDQDNSESTEVSEKNIATVATATFVELRTGFSRMNDSTKVAGVAVILAAVFLAYLGFRSKSALSRSKQNSGSLPTSQGPAGIGGKFDSSTSSVIHHSPGTEKTSAPQDLHEQFASGDKAGTVNASVSMTSWQLETEITPTPADYNHPEKTSSPSSPSVTPTDAQRAEKETDASPQNFSTEPSSDSDLPSVKPFEEVLAVNSVGYDGTPAAIADLETEAQPFEQVVAVNGVGYESSTAKAAETESDAVQFQNALIYDKPQAAEGLWPKQDARPTFETPMGASVSELEEAAQDNKDDGPVEKIGNGAAATTSAAQLEEEKRRSYSDAVAAVVPAIAVGAGALTILSGVASGFQIVGLMATASFLAREVVMASSRQQLCEEISKVKDHKSFLEFLKSRQIINDLPQE